MSKVLHHKVVVSLPDPLEPDSIYYVRTGAGFDIYITNGAGVVTAYRLNAQDTVPQTEAEEGTSATRRAWTAERVWQAMAAWWGGVSTALSRTLLSRTTAAQVRGDLELGTAATKNIGTDAGNVMEVGAFGLGRGISQIYDADLAPAGSFTAVNNGAFGGSTISGPVLTFSKYGGAYGGQIAINNGGSTVPILLARTINGGIWYPEVEIIHSGNQLNLGLTPTTARTALNLFTDSSGVITNGSGALTNDVSAFLSLNTYADMSVKVQGTHNYVELANNSTSLTPLAGYYYLLPRTTEAALTHTFTCTYSATTVKTWRMLVTRTWTTSTALGPVFSVSGLSGSVIINGVFERANLKALIEFTQIGQNVIGQIVAQWS